MEFPLLLVARDDLKAARILFEAELYPGAVYHFQQSVEKGYKQLGLQTGQISEDDLISHIRHNPEKIHRQSAKEKENQIARVKKGISDLGLHVPETLGKVNFLEDAIAEAKELFSMDGESLISSEVLDALETQLASTGDLDIQESDEHIDLVEHELLQEIFKKLPNNEKDMLQKQVTNIPTKDIIEYTSRIIPLTVRTHGIMAYLSEVIKDIGTTVRYPTSKQIPSEIYNEKHPLITHFRRLCGLQEKYLETLPKYAALLHKYNDEIE